MSWLKFLGLILRLALIVADIVRERGQMDAGEAKAVAKALEESNARVEKARAARLASDAGGVPDDDPYRRD